MGTVDCNRITGETVQESGFEDKMAHKPGHRFVEDLQDARAFALVVHRDRTDGTEPVYLFDVV